jgi:uncharacterized protein (TIGR01777 family)
MKVLVAGATGLIGKHLIPALQKKGHQIVVLTRNVLKAKLLIEEHVEFIEWNSEPTAELIKAIETADAIINLAGENLNAKTWSNSQKKIIIDSRVNAVKKLSHAIMLASHKPKVFLQASATGYYGTECYTGVDESGAKGIGFLADVVEQWEKADDEVEKSGIRYILLRTGVVLEPNEGALTAMVMPFKLGVGGHLGKGDQYISWIHYQDEINAIVYLLENENLSGTFNLTAPNPVSMREFAKSLGKSHNRPSWFHIPAPFLKIVMGEKAKEMILSSTNALPKRLLESGFSFKFKTIDEAFQDLFK